MQQLTRHRAPDRLQPFHAYYLGQARFYAGDLAGAARSFEVALRDAPAWLVPRARARLGESLLAQGMPASARPILEQAANDSPGPELLFQRAQARRLTGDAEGAGDDLRALVVRYAAHPYAATALFNLSASSERHQTALTFDERLSRARVLLDNGQANAALGELEGITEQKLARGALARARLGLVRAVASFAAGEVVRGEQALDQAIRGPESVAAEAMLLRARRLMRGDDNAQAKQALLNVARKYPRQLASEEATYLAAWIDLQAGHFGDAVRGFDQFDKQHPTSRRRDEALWFRSLALIRQGDLEQARLSLRRLVSQFPSSALVPQARYWAARAQQLSKIPTEGAFTSEYEQVVRLFPGSYYAQLSSERLKELGRPMPSVFPSPKLRDGAVPEELALAVALARVGLFRDAGEEVQSRVSGLRNADQGLRFGRALLTLGEYGQAYAIGVRLLWGAAYGARDPEALAILYPRAFRESVEAEAKSRGVDPFLIWAIMRRESAFRPEAASAANARGLMQLIPPTSVAIARELSIAPPDPAELFAPQVNIQLASWYLGALLKRFGHPALLAGAYNAGPSVVARWAQQKGDLPLDLWVEEIPYRETRAYVKQVLADYLLYHALYGDPATAPRLALTVPAAVSGVDF